MDKIIPISDLQTKAKKYVEQYVKDGNDPSFTLVVGSPPDYQRTAAIIQQQNGRDRARAGLLDQRDDPRQQVG